MKSTILVICGPTASGKTGLALSIASKLPRVNILSADSRQIYQGLDIVTGKDIPKTLPANIKLFGLDLTGPDSSFNLSDYVDYSKKVISESLTSSVPLIIVGGTGLYLKAVTSNFFNVNIPPNPKLRKILEKKDLEELQRLLQKINPQKYQSLNASDVKNPRRLIRAIEISKSTHQINSGSITGPVKTSLKFIWLGLKQDKTNLKDKIHQRVLERLNSGAIKEVQALQKQYTDPSLPIYTALGVKEILQFLSEEITWEELIRSWTAAEVDYARRQMVWFKKQPGIIWYDRDKVDDKLLGKFVKLIKND